MQHDAEEVTHDRVQHVCLRVALPPLRQKRDDAGLQEIKRFLEDEEPPDHRILAEQVAADRPFDQLVIVVLGPGLARLAGGEQFLLALLQKIPDGALEGLGGLTQHLLEPPHQFEGTNPFLAGIDEGLLEVALVEVDGEQEMENPRLQVVLVTEGGSFDHHLFGLDHGLRCRSRPDTVPPHGTGWRTGTGPGCPGRRAARRATASVGGPIPAGRPS